MVSWSSGKDSAWALHTLRQQPERYDVRGIFTTVTKTFDRVSIHSTPAWVLKQQVRKTRRAVIRNTDTRIRVPTQSTKQRCESSSPKWKHLPEHLTASHFAFGDLFLEDIRAYRQDKLRGTGFTPIFPVWGEDTTQLSEKMIASGMRAIITALNPTKVPADFAGRWFDADLIADLPDGVDPLGENGEFHTCVVDGPMFNSPVAAKPGEVVQTRHRLCQG